MESKSEQYLLEILSEKEFALLQYLTDIANRECFYDDETSDDLCVEDYVGRNVEDAFDLGEKAGKVMLARKLLEMLSEKE